MKNPDGNMTNERGRFQDLGFFFLLGLILCGVAFLAPDAGHRIGAFFTLAAHTSWLVWFQAQPAWCSLKIILFSIGLFFVIDAVGAGLGRLGHPSFAWTVHSLQLANLALFLAGGFYFIKALL